MVARAFGKRLDEVIYVDYNNVDLTIESFINEADSEPRMLIISDICPKEATLNSLRDEIEDGVFEAVLLDHHKTTKWISKCEEDWIIHDENKCGTLLVHEWLKGLGLMEDMDGSLYFATAVDAYDRWILHSGCRARGEQLNRLVWFLGFERFVEEFSEDWHFETGTTMRYIEGCLVGKEERSVTRAVSDNLQEANIFRDREGRCYALFPSSGYVSQVGNAILEDDDSIEYVVVINATHNKLEFRSRQGGVDVSEIAKRLGGGGHPAAAGCTLPIMDSVKVFVAGLF